MADKDVEDLLTAWGLEKYIQIFKDNDIRLATLPLLTNEMMVELIPIIGHRAVLRSELEQWRSILSDASNPSVAATDQAQSFSQASVDSFSSDIDTPSPSPIVTPASSPISFSESGGVFASSESIASSSTSSGEVYDLLRRTNEGRSLLQFQAAGLLNSAGRRKLCNLIINNQLQDDANKRISSATLYALAHQITSIFNKEHIATYFIPYLSFGPGLKRSAKGKLLDCLNNRRREYRKSGIISGPDRPRISSNKAQIASTSSSLVTHWLNETENTLLVNSSIEENIQWLKNSSDPWQTVESHWEKTVHVRIAHKTNTTQTIAQYFEEFPALKKPLGYLLLSKDFQFAYPYATFRLYETLPLHKPKIIDLITEKLKKSTEVEVNRYLSDLIELGKGNEETSNLAALLALPYLITTSVVKKGKGKAQWRPSKVEAREGFICHVKSDAEIVETVTRKRNKLSELSVPVQPYIIGIGPALNDIKGYVIVVNDVFYRLQTVLSAVDYCFKTIFALNAEYPAECAPVWYFVQRAFYQITTPWDKNYTAVNTLLSEVGITSTSNSI